MCIISSQSLAVGNSYLTQGGKEMKEGGELLVRSTIVASNKKKRGILKSISNSQN
jgi:hypothetical protein